MKEARTYYFNFFYTRFLSSCKGWKDEEIGAYIQLLIEQFDKGFIPEDPDELSRLITSYKKTWPRISKKFKPGKQPGQLINQFMDEIREKAVRKKETNAANGKTGGRPKKPMVSKIETKEKPNGSENKSESKATTIGYCLIDSSPYEGGAGETPEPIGIDAVKAVAREVWESQAWCESICIGHSIDMGGLKKWMAQFNSSICNDVMEVFDKAKYQKLFGGWLNRQKGKGYNLTNSLPKDTAAPPLKTI